jgi:hypothetical protein
MSDHDLIIDQRGRAMLLRMGFAAVVMVASVGRSMADETPLSGYYHYMMIDDHQSAELDDLACATAFFRQNSDGTGDDYVLDRQKYLATGEIAFVRAANFICDYTAASRTETCETTTFHTAFSGGTSYFRYYSISADGAVLDTYLDKAAYDASFKGALSVDEDQRTRASYIKCDWLMDAALKGHLVEWDASMTDDEVIDAYTDPFSQSDRDRMLDVARRIKAALTG